MIREADSECYVWSLYCEHKGAANKRWLFKREALGGWSRVMCKLRDEWLCRGSCREVHGDGLIECVGKELSVFC